ncbi:MAG: type III pantothenate kinase [Leptospiraceae bacterium]|nr:type III pantothenate kinase [Leptospiraceae bacterium]MDW7975517.1 type III pantothenate kinase [Leptospiraceae bacterium]
MSYLLAVDVGNTNTVFGLFDGDTLVRSWRIVTKKEWTSDELGVYLNNFLQSANYQPNSIHQAIYSSVVPSFNPILDRMIKEYYHCDPIRVVYNMKLPLKFKYPRPFELGADRIVNAVAGITLYGKDLIIVDLGTATTFCLIKEGDYHGGVIAPGLRMSIEALHAKTALLPLVEFTKPPSGIIGDSTVHSIQAGFFYGWVGMLKEIINNMKAKYSETQFQVIATGGFSQMIHREVPNLFDIVDYDLTLKGLKFIFDYQKS